MRSINQARGTAFTRAVRPRKRAYPIGEGGQVSSPTARSWARGGVVFAAVVMMLSGVFQLFQGIAAITKDQFFVVGANYAYKIDTTAWGWIHLVLGIIVAITGFFLLSNSGWAYGAAIGLVMLQALAQFFWLPYFPLWALLIIALDIFVIWALVHSPDVESVDPQYERQPSERL